MAPINDDTSDDQPPICDACQLPTAEATHGDTSEWACVRDICENCFRSTAEQLADPHQIFIFGRPQRYHCRQRRDVTRVGNVVRFTCPNGI